VTNLHLNVLVTTVGEVTGRTRTHSQVWSSPITTFPLATPFLISDSSGTKGGGVVLHHIHLMCGDDGNKPSALFTWAELR